MKWRTIKSKKDFNRESEATTRLINFLEKENPKWFLWKIPDIWNVNKIFDLIWTWDNWIFLWREIKFIREKKISYESVYSKLEFHQIISLYRVKEAWWNAMVIAYHKENKEFIFYPFSIIEDD